MIKCFYLTSLILILSSCNGFSINRDSVSSIMSIFSDPGKKYYVSKELFDQSQYSFARVSFGNNVAIIVLVEEDSFGRQHWISSDGMKFITFICHPSDHGFTLKTQSPLLVQSCNKRLIPIIPLTEVKRDSVET